MVTNATLPKITQRFVRDLPQNTSLLNVHCQSKDNDIEVQTLNVCQQFDFSFHQNLWGSTLFFFFFCNFEWGSKHTVFDVFYK